MGGRGAAGTTKTTGARIVTGVSIGKRLFAKESDVAKMSPNVIWAFNTSTPHALLKNSSGSTQIRGDKKDRYSLLEHVNTAIIHLSGVDRSVPKREITVLNKQLSEIRSRGFDVQRISVGEFESVAYIKRKLFTRRAF